MAEQVIESLADAISQLTGYLISLQEVNAEPPPELPTKGQQVTMVADVLVKVAKQTAEGFKAFPTLKDEIDKEADKVSVFNGDLSKALSELVVAEDRKQAYSNLLDACKAIATSTCYLLILVYGARVKAIVIKAEQCREEVKKMREFAKNDDQVSEGMMAEVGAVTNEYAYLVGLVGSRAKEVTDPDEQQKLVGHHSALNNSRQQTVDTVNGWIQAPEDPAAKQAAVDWCDSLEGLLDDLIRDAKPPEDADAFGQMEKSFNEKQDQAKGAVQARKNNQIAARDLAQTGSSAAGAVPSVAAHEQPLLAAAAEVATAAGAEVDHIQKEPEKVPEDSKVLQEKVKAFSEAGKTATAAEPDAAAKQALEGKVANIGKLADELDTAAKENAEKKEDPALIKTVAEKSKALNDAIDDLVREAVKRNAAKEAAERAAAQAALADALASVDSDTSRKTPANDVLAAAKQLLDDADMTVKDVGENPSKVPADAKVEDDDTDALQIASTRLGHKISDAPADQEALKKLTDDVVKAEQEHTAACRKGAGSNDPADATAVNATTAKLADAVKALAKEVTRKEGAKAKDSLAESAGIATAMAGAVDDPAEKEMLQHAQALGDAAQKITEDARNSPGGVPADAEEMSKITNALTEAGKKAAANEDDPAARDALLENIAAVSNASGELAAAAKTAAEKPGDTAAQAAMNDKAAALADALSELVGGSAGKHFHSAKEKLANAAASAGSAAQDATHHERAILENVKIIADNGVALLDATQSDDVEKSTLAADSEKLNANVHDFVKAGKAASAVTEDPEEKKVIMNTTKAIAMDAAKVMKAGAAALANPKDYAAKAALNQSSEELAKSINNLVAHANEKRAKEAARRAAVKRDMPFSQELKQAHDDGKQAVADTAKAADAASAGAAARADVANGQKMMDVLAALSDNASDPSRKKALKDARAAVKDNLDKVEAAAPAYSENPADGAAKGAMDGAANGLGGSLGDALTVAATDAAVADLQDAAFNAKNAAGVASSPEKSALLKAAEAEGKAAAGMVGSAKCRPEKVNDDIIASTAAMKALEEAGARAAEVAATPEEKAAVEADVAALKAAGAAAVAAAQKLAASPDDAAANVAMGDTGSALANAINDLVNHCKGQKTRAAEVADAARGSAMAGGAVAAAVDAGNKDAGDEAVKNAMAAGQEMSRVLDSLAADEPDAATKAALGDASKAVTDACAALAGAASEWSADPSNAEKKAKMNEALDQVKAATGKGLAVAVPVAAKRDLADTAEASKAAAAADPAMAAGEKDILAAVEACTKAAGDMVGDVKDGPAAVEGDVPKLAAASADVAKAAQKIADELKASGNPADAADAKRLEDGAKAVENAQNALAEASKAAAAAPEDEAALTKVAQAAEQLDSALKQVVRDAENRGQTAAKKERDAVTADLKGIENAAAAARGQSSEAQAPAVDALAATAAAAADVLNASADSADPNRAASTAAAAAAATTSAAALKDASNAPAAAKVAEAADKLAKSAAAAAAAPAGDVAAARTANSDAAAAAEALKEVLAAINDADCDAAVASLRDASKRAGDAAPAASPAEQDLIKALQASGDATAALVDTLKNSPDQVEAVAQDAAAKQAALAAAARKADAAAAGKGAGARQGTADAMKGAGDDANKVLEAVRSAQDNAKALIAQVDDKAGREADAARKSALENASKGVSDALAKLDAAAKEYASSEDPGKAKPAVEKALEELTKASSDAMKLASVDPAVEALAAAAANAKAASDTAAADAKQAAAAGTQESAVRATTGKAAARASQEGAGGAANAAATGPAAMAGTAEQAGLLAAAAAVGAAATTLAGDSKGKPASVAADVAEVTKSLAALQKAAGDATAAFPNAKDAVDGDVARVQAAAAALAPAAKALTAKEEDFAANEGLRAAAQDMAAAINDLVAECGQRRGRAGALANADAAVASYTGALDGLVATSDSKNGDVQAKAALAAAREAQRVLDDVAAGEADAGTKGALADAAKAIGGAAGDLEGALKDWAAAPADADKKAAVNDGSRKLRDTTAAGMAVAAGAAGKRDLADTAARGAAARDAEVKAAEKAGAPMVAEELEVVEALLAVSAAAGDLAEGAAGADGAAKTPEASKALGKAVGQLVAAADKAAGKEAAYDPAKALRTGARGVSRAAKNLDDAAKEVARKPKLRRARGRMLEAEEEVDNELQRMFDLFKARNAAKRQAAANGDDVGPRRVVRAADKAGRIANDALTAAKRAAMAKGDPRAAQKVNEDTAAMARAVDGLVAAAAAKKRAQDGKRRLAVADAIRGNAKAAAEPLAGDSAPLAALKGELTAFGDAAAALVAADAGKGDDVQGKKGAVAERVAALEAALKPAADAEKDEGARGRLTEAAQQAVDGAKSMMAAADAVAASPEDGAAQEAMLAGGEGAAEGLAKMAGENARKGHDDAKGKLKMATLGLGGIPDMDGLGDLLGLANQLSKAMGDLCGDLPDLSPEGVQKEVAKIKAVKDSMRDAARMGQMECKNKDVKDVLRKDMPDINKACDAALAAAVQQSKNPSPENDQKYIDAVNHFGDVMAKFAEDMAKASGVEEEAAGGQASDQVIANLANEIEESAKKYQKGEYAEFKDEQIILQGLKLAELMAILAEAARNGERTKIIATAKAINDLVKEASKEGNGIAKGCPNPKLKSDVTTATGGMRNYGVQLKIIASVKAASTETDESAENQLITCCTGIATCMEQTMASSVAAKIASK